MKKVGFYFLAYGIIILVLLSILELGVRTYDLYFADQKLTTFKEFRLTRPFPYQKSEYFSREFIDESFIQPNGYHFLPNSVVFLPNDFKGKYFNYENGFRQTIKSNSVASHTIYLIGGSTVQCSETPDDYTIASFLQKKINSTDKERYQVINLGASSVNSYQELARLKTININPEDLVLIYDGHNDAYHTFNNNSAQGYIVGFNKTTLKERPLYLTFLIRAYSILSENSLFIRYLLNPYDYNKIPDHLLEQKRLLELGKEFRTNYIKNITQMSKYVESRKANFFHFLQPNLYTKSYFSNYEQSLMKNKVLVNRPISVIFKFAVPEMRASSIELKNLKIKSFDLTKIFDDRKDEVYLDAVHVSDIGNEIIASSIFELIKDSLKK